MVVETVRPHGRTLVEPRLLGRCTQVDHRADTGCCEPGPIARGRLPRTPDATLDLQQVGYAHGQ